jgi:hypothetical protein
MALWKIRYLPERKRSRCSTEHATPHTAFWKIPPLSILFTELCSVRKAYTGGIIMSEKDENSDIKNTTVRMDDGSIRTFLAREKTRFVDSNGCDIVVLDVFDPNNLYYGPITEITGSLVK